jgi:hypothetical protein
MAARTSMATLIARLRVLVGDPAGSPTFGDEELQDFLDERRLDVVEAALRTRQSNVSGLISYLDFYAPRRWWEASVVLTNSQGAALTPSASDLITGHWSFTTSQAIPVYITGSCFDLYGTAQAVCESWAAKVAREFDFGTDQQTFDRTGKREGLLAVAREYARKAIPPGERPAWRSPYWG